MTTVYNFEYLDDGFGTSPPQSLTFTGTAGRRLVILSFTLTGEMTSLTDNQGNIYTELFEQQTAVGAKYWMTDEADGVTTLYPNMDASSTPRMFIIEVDGIAPAAQQPATTTNHQSDGDGFVVSHDFPYTTSQPGELVFSGGNPTSSRTVTGTDGTVGYPTGSPALTRIAFYKIVDTPESGTINWDFNAAANCSILQITLVPEVSGQIPLQDVMRSSNIKLYG